MTRIHEQMYLEFNQQNKNSMHEHSTILVVKTNHSSLTEIMK